MTKLVTPKLWMAQLCEGDARAMLKLFAPKAIVMPGESVFVSSCHTRSQIKAHFTELYESRPNLYGRIDSVKLQRIAGLVGLGETRVYSGLCTFRWKRKKSVRARYTLVVTDNGIIHQHVSEVPRLTIRSRSLRRKKK
jgi:hypothetical protein